MSISSDLKRQRKSMSDVETLLDGVTAGFFDLTGNVKLQLQIALEMMRRSKPLILSLERRQSAAMKRVMNQAVVLIASEEYVRSAYPNTSVSSALRKLKSEYACEKLGVTLGRKGSRFLIDAHPPRWLKTPAYKTVAIDETGAGDAFAAGILIGTVRGFGFPESVALATALGSLAVEQIGFFEKLPLAAEVSKRKKAVERS